MSNNYINNNNNGFNKALFISIPEDEIQDNCNDAHKINTSHEHIILSESLLEKIEGTTPVSINKIITYDNEMEESEYVYEKFGKKGWQCLYCNNFNFESRVKCNRCGVIKTPKSLQKIKEDEMKDNVDKKKKTLVEREGDWLCPKCKNLNFAFRILCNRCKLDKPSGINQIQPNYISNNNNHNYMWNNNIGNESYY